MPEGNRFLFTKRLLLVAFSSSHPYSKMITDLHKGPPNTPIILFFLPLVHLVCLDVSRPQPFHCHAFKCYVSAGADAINVYMQSQAWDGQTHAASCVIQLLCAEKSWFKDEQITIIWMSYCERLLPSYRYFDGVYGLWPAMQHDCDVVELGQSCRRHRPLHALPVIGHRSHIGKPSLHLPEVGLDLVALIAAHDGVDCPHPPAPHPS